MIRRPAVAGQFYPDEKRTLKEMVKGFISDGERVDALGVVAPHAGFVYSGRVAGRVYSKVKERPTVIILGVNHRGRGRPFAIVKEGIWETPLGGVEVETQFAETLLASSDYLEEDEDAHQFEHSLEVQLPFLQVCFRNPFRIVPICISHYDVKSYQALGREIASKIEDPGQVLIIASTDLTHYESQQEARRKDEEVISAILHLDEEDLFSKTQRFNISMCGYAPTITMLASTKALGAREAELVEYMTSGDVSGDYGSVVGYAGMIIK